ncbi:MAG: hypothetical protein ACOYVG_09975 [Bacteroidota bacterium]
MLINFLFFLFAYLLLELSYFAIARKFEIVDKPNIRSSHQQVTIRGGGVLFPIAALFFISYTSFDGVLLSCGICTISILSFVDDVRSIDSKLRLLLQGLAVAFMLYPIIKGINLYWVPFFFILILGVINAYNFMDGINGITVMYSLVSIGTLYYINKDIFILESNTFFLSVIASLVVFAFFNVRKKAICFAGDVGSISIAFIICYLLIKLVWATNWPCWILLLGVYGIDTVFTIICRIFRKEPLMQAHRSHFYQYLANETGMGQLKVSLLYAVTQLLLNLTVIFSYLHDIQWLSSVTLFGFLIIYSIFRFQFEGSKRLFDSYNPD